MGNNLMIHFSSVVNSGYILLHKALLDKTTMQTFLVVQHQIRVHLQGFCRVYKVTFKTFRDIPYGIKFNTSFTTIPGKE